MIIPKRQERDSCASQRILITFLMCKNMDLKPETLHKKLIIGSFLLLGLEISQKLFSVMIALFLVSRCKTGLSATFISQYVTLSGGMYLEVTFL